MAEALKARGNELFKNNDFAGAEELYTQSLEKDRFQPSVFSNRAMVRQRQHKWAASEADARAALALLKPADALAIKAAYYRTTALLQMRKLHVPGREGAEHEKEPGDQAGVDGAVTNGDEDRDHTSAEALEVAIAAYRLAIDTRNANAEPLAKLVLLAKKAIWEEREAVRLRQTHATLGQVEELLESDMARELAALREAKDCGEVGEVGYEEDVEKVKAETVRRIGVVREAFAARFGDELKERVVPDYLIDNISFEVMQDPVVTPCGHSFDRAVLTRHLAAHPFDPVTRQPMSARDLRPNYALKAACDEFLEKNGWAADW